ncbi:NTP transferase domain-containing protein [Sphingorhabdus sp. YGSMI21]|uniref:NTP transferase domain-containing protein n=1 Tax=Sphingorhabdus sp. YGSMI21 TaxID=2077182 RepID=UPI001F0B7B66|nr:NTP transferase domain-containing protein [Sphingorhabdus sp. YGSMI21]
MPPASKPDKSAGDLSSARKPLWTAIILAGQRPEGDPMAEYCNVRYKALIPIHGQTMLERVTRTLMASPHIGRIVIMAQSPGDLQAGLSPDLAEHGAIAFVPSNDGIATSIHGVVGSDIAPWPVLVTTADNALLTGEILDGFFKGHSGQDVAVGVVERRTMLAAYPDARRTWLKFRGGAYSGANLFALLDDRAKPAVAFWSSVEKDRKKGWKIFAHFGPSLLLRALSRTIGFRQAMAQAGERMGLRAEPVILTTAEAAIDVDKPEDLALVTAILEQRERCPAD